MARFYPGVGSTLDRARATNSSLGAVHAIVMDRFCSLNIGRVKSHDRNVVAVSPFPNMTKTRCPHPARKNAREESGHRDAAPKVLESAKTPKSFPAKLVLP